jgi:thioesterase domain-containing protein
MLMKIPARQKAGFFLEKAKNVAKLIVNGPETSLPQNSTRSILREAMHLYKPKPFPGNIMLIRADKSNDMNKLGWETSGKGRIAVHCIPAEHETLLKEPFVDMVAKYINEQLAKVIK